ncbi:diacylglycerol kinase family protein [Methyloligella solikamskensis]|uniref:Diacylglycerol kinase family protein n=1 Tax=Methyloligella solikamskensis TaxID=1177756 RepID=A0ABW3J670_9HYPH
MRSFGFAFEGLGFVVRTQPHMRIHLLAAALAIALGAILSLSATEWLWVIAAIAAVLAGECLNTAIEHLCDVVCPEENIAVKRTKDVAAGMVLIAAIGAVAVGGVIFLPKLEASLHAEAGSAFPMICESAS